MGRMVLGIGLISFGLGSLFKSWGWLPLNFCSSYQTWAREYWPLLFILGGIRILVKEHLPVLEKLLTVLILISVGLWIFCSIWARQEWLNV
ncbi:MAG TPA: DUF5668 domain-containing protein [Bacillota bacterium]